jgi:hypothetical protein
MRRSHVGAGVVGLVVGTACLLGLSQDVSRDSRLANSVGLECTVYFNVPIPGSEGASRADDGLRTRDNTPRLLEGLLTGVSDESVTIRKNNKVYWINTDAVAMIEFEHR